MKVILLNGPRGVGKDTAAAALMKPERTLWPVMKAAKLRVLELCNVDAELIGVYESVKDTPLDEFFGQSFRDAVIKYANKKRSEDRYHFAKAWASDVRNALLTPYADDDHIVVVPDVRFFEEFIVACDLVGGKNVLLARVFRDGYGWKGDVGGYIRTDMAVFGNGEISLYNNWDRDGFELEAKVLAGMWLKRAG